MTDYRDQMSLGQPKGVFSSMSEAPSAAAYGVGPAWIGGKLYWSNGIKYQRNDEHIGRVVLIGDSMTQQNNIKGFLLNAQSPSLPSSIVYAGSDVNMPVGAGSLDYDALLKRVRWSAYGDSYGDYVSISKSGYYKIDSSSAGHAIYIGVLAGSLPGSSQVYSLTFIASGHQDEKKSFGYANWLSFLSGGGFSIVANVGVSGAKLADMVSTLSALDSVDFDTAIFMGGTNDITVTSFNDIQSSFLSIIDYFSKRSARLFVLPIPPRGTGSTALAKEIGNFNKWIEDICKNASGVYFVNTLHALIDRSSSTDNAISGALYDGLHPAPIGAYLIGKAASARMQSFVKKREIASVSYGNVYDATANTYGNLIPGQSSVFEGTGGSVNTGITTSTGVPTGLNCRRESGNVTVVGTVNTEARSGSSGKNLVIAVTTAANNEAIRVENSSAIVTGVTAGDRLIAYADIEVAAQTSLQRMSFTVFFSTSDGQTFFYYGTGQAYSTFSLFPSGELPVGRIVIDDIFVPNLVTGMSFRINVGCLSGGSATVKIGDIFIGKKP